MVSLLSTFETLSDEILMIIFRYSENVTSTFRTFSGLNQRLNRILVDRRLHLFTNFLRINVRQDTFNYYYDTPLFHTLSQQLCSLQGNDHAQELDQCFQRLVSFHIQEKSHHVEQQFRSDREQFHLIRANLTSEEVRFRDALLKKAFNDLQSHSFNLEYLRKIENLVIGTGARLECTDNELDEYNLTSALNQCLLAHLYTVGYPNRSCLQLIKRLFKALIVSNPNLLSNKNYVGNGGSPLYFFLIYAVFRLQSFYRVLRPIPISMQKYETILDLLLFAFQYLKQASDECMSVRDCLLNSLYLVPTIENNPDEKIFIRCSQTEVLKMLFHEMTRKQIPFDEYSNYMLQEGLKNLIITNRIDIIEYVYRQNSFMQDFLTRSDHCRKFVDTINGTRRRRKVFQHFLDEKSLEPWLTSTTLLFILLEKKECKWIKKLLQLDSTLVHRVDGDGNHPLLYVCLKVNGCRHRLIEFLIGRESDLHKRNVHDEHFIQAIQLKRNRKLLKQLIEHGIIVREHESGQLQVFLTEQLHLSIQN